MCNYVTGGEISCKEMTPLSRPTAQSCKKVQAAAISCKNGQFLSVSARPGRTRAPGLQHCIYDWLVVIRVIKSQFSGKVFGAEPKYVQKFGSESKIRCSCGPSNHTFRQKYRVRNPISFKSWVWNPIKLSCHPDMARVNHSFREKYRVRNPISVKSWVRNPKSVAHAGHQITVLAGSIRLGTEIRSKVRSRTEIMTG